MNYNNLVVKSFTKKKLASLCANPFFACNYVMFLLRFNKVQKYELK